uniref:Putative secreted protein n=1 Tax=Rhipicephalus microplus TaxID=6941 RepID=A0A6M2DAA1_RHIMP
MTGACVCACVCVYLRRALSGITTLLQGWGRLSLCNDCDTRVVAAVPGVNGVFSRSLKVSAHTMLAPPHFSPRPDCFLFAVKPFVLFRDV